MIYYFINSQKEYSIFIINLKEKFFVFVDLIFHYFSPIRKGTDSILRRKSLLGQSVSNIFSEGSDLGIEQGNSIRDDFSIVISGLSSLGVVEVFIITPLSLISFLDGFLINSGLLVSLLLSSHIDSSGQNIDSVVQLSDLGLFVVDSLLDGVLGVSILFNPMLVGSSLKLSRFRDLGNNFLAELNNLLDSRLVRLDSWSLSNLSEETENRVPGLSGILVLLDVLLNVGGNLGENWGNLGNLDQVGLGLQSIGDNALGLFNSVLGSVVLILDMGPFLVLKGLLSIQFSDLLVIEFDQSEFSVSLVSSLISSGNLDAEFLSQLSNSVLGFSNFIIEFSDFLIALVLEAENEFVIASLFVLQLVFHVSQ